MIRVACPHCKAALKTDHFSQRLKRCPLCKQVVELVPVFDSESAQTLMSLPYRPPPAVRRDLPPVPGDSVVPRMRRSAFLSGLAVGLVACVGALIASFVFWWSFFAKPVRPAIIPQAAAPPAEAAPVADAPAEPPDVEEPPPAAAMPQPDVPIKPAAPRPVMPVPQAPRAEDGAAEKEVKQLVEHHRAILRSRHLASLDRTLAATALGDLKEKAKAARRDLCEAMLDVSIKVRTAAADALGLIDHDLHELAVKLVVDGTVEAVEEAGRLRAEGEPLTPLVLRMADLLATRASHGDLVAEHEALAACVRTLAAIARDDPAANKFVLAMLTHRSLAARGAAVQYVRDMKQHKEALKPLAVIAHNDVEAIRLHAIEALMLMRDKDNDNFVRQVVTEMRYDGSPAVRKAVADAMTAWPKP